MLSADDSTQRKSVKWHLSHVIFFVRVSVKQIHNILTNEHHEPVCDPRWKSMTLENVRIGIYTCPSRGMRDPLVSSTSALCIAGGQRSGAGAEVREVEITPLCLIERSFSRSWDYSTIWNQTFWINFLAIFHQGQEKPQITRPGLKLRLLWTPIKVFTQMIIGIYTDCSPTEPSLGPAFLWKLALQPLNISQRLKSTVLV